MNKKDWWSTGWVCGAPPQKQRSSIQVHLTSKQNTNVTPRVSPSSTVAASSSPPPGITHNALSCRKTWDGPVRRWRDAAASLSSASMQRENGGVKDLRRDWPSAEWLLRDRPTPKTQSWMWLTSGQVSLAGIWVLQLLHKLTFDLTNWTLPLSLRHSLTCSLPGLSSNMVFLQKLLQRRLCRFPRTFSSSPLPVPLARRSMKLTWRLRKTILHPQNDSLPEQSKRYWIVWRSKLPHLIQTHSNQTIRPTAELQTQIVSSNHFSLHCAARPANPKHSRISTDVKLRLNHMHFLVQR